MAELRERVFSKMACLSRVNAGMNNQDEMAFRAHCTALVTGAEPVVLHRMAQSAVDRGAPEDFILISMIPNENLKLNRDKRAFPNTALLDLVEPSEYLAAIPLLASVIDLEREADAAYQQLKGHVDRASLLRISRGLAAVKLDKDGIPFAGGEE